MARVLASSRYATDLLLRPPEAVAMLADDAELDPAPGRGAARRGARRRAQARRAGGRRRGGPGVRRRELFRIAAADLLGLSDVDETGEALTDVAAATLSAALEAAVRTAEAQPGPLPTRLA